MEPPTIVRLLGAYRFSSNLLALEDYSTVASDSSSVSSLTSLEFLFKENSKLKSITKVDMKVISNRTTVVIGVSNVVINHAAAIEIMRSNRNSPMCNIDIPCASASVIIAITKMMIVNPQNLVNPAYVEKNGRICIISRVKPVAIILHNGLNRLINTGRITDNNPVVPASSGKDHQVFITL